MGSPSTIALGHGLVIMNAHNASGSEKMSMGNHGFVWIFTKGGGSLLDEQIVHVFTQSVLKERPERVWYKGMYKAHHTKVFLPPSAWLQLPAKVRTRHLATPREGAVIDGFNCMAYIFRREKLRRIFEVQVRRRLSRQRASNASTAGSKREQTMRSSCYSSIVEYPAETSLTR